MRFWASFRTIDGGSDDDRFFGPPRRPTGTSNGVKSRLARGASSGSKSRSYCGKDGMNSLPTASISNSCCMISCNAAAGPARFWDAALRP